MKRDSQSIMKLGVICVAGIFFFLQGAVYAQTDTAVGPPKPVEVVNTASKPIPVSGTVSVTSPVTVTGTVSVSNLSNPLPVNGTVIVENSGSNPLLVRDVNNPARTLYSNGFAVILESGKATYTGVISSGAPAGKRLFIEYVTAFCGVVPGRKPMLTMGGVDAQGVADSTAMRPVFHYQSSDDGGLDIYVASEMVKFFTAPGGTFNYRITQSPSPGGNGGCVVNVTGYLTDAP